MEPLSSFLKKFQNFVPKEISLKRFVKDAVLEVVGVDLKNENIKINPSGDIFIETSPNVKTQIFIKKQKIIEFLQNKTGSKTIFNIRYNARFRGLLFIGILDFSPN